MQVFASYIWPVRGGVFLNNDVATLLPYEIRIYDQPIGQGTILAEFLTPPTDPNGPLTYQRGLEQPLWEILSVESLGIIDGFAQFKYTLWEEETNTIRNVNSATLGRDYRIENFNQFSNYSGNNNPFEINDPIIFLKNYSPLSNVEYVQESTWQIQDILFSNPDEFMPGDHIIILREPRNAENQWAKPQHNPYYITRVGNNLIEVVNHDGTSTGFLNKNWSSPQSDFFKKTTGSVTHIVINHPQDPLGSQNFPMIEIPFVLYQDVFEKYTGQFIAPDPIHPDSGLHTGYTSAFTTDPAGDFVAVSAQFTIDLKLWTNQQGQVYGWRNSIEVKNIRIWANGGWVTDGGWWYQTNNVFHAYRQPRSTQNTITRLVFNVGDTIEENREYWLTLTFDKTLTGNSYEKIEKDISLPLTWKQI
jgi:hypothetical protein